MKKVKHDHKGTKLLKLGIFASLMLAPLLAIAFKCAYVTFNKNAKDSYSGANGYTYEYKYDTNDVNERTDIKTNNIYTFTLEYHNQTSPSQVGSILFIKQNNVNEEASVMEFNSPVACYLYTTGGQFVWYVNLYGGNGGTIKLDATLPTQLVFNNLSSNFYNFGDFENVSACANEDNVLTGVTISNIGTLDNAFYYAIDEMKNNELFNWTTNTALYTPTAAMTNGMGITTNALPILITYWLYLTAIYIVIDIVVELFTALTHMITSKLDT